MAMTFPKDFVLGAAAASYQVEGAAYEDGKGLSVWDVFCKKDKAIRDGYSGDVSCDHYHRYKDDVALMKQIGLKAYRFSVSWPRVLPGGAGAVNEKGISFYDRLVDELLASGITPFLTLFHWDYPQDLFKRGGWQSADSPQWFADYAQIIAKRLGDRVTHWMTLNEPQCTVALGHGSGNHAPGLKLDRKGQLQVLHNILLSHGRAVQVLRASCKAQPTIGCAVVGSVDYPHSDSKEDVEAARSSTMSTSAKSFGWSNTMYADPVCLGDYPAEAFSALGQDMPKIGQRDMETIHQPMDFYGVNIYQGNEYRAGEDGKPTEVKRTAGYPLTAMPWPVTPQALYWGPRFLYERYKLPIYVTENGMANPDWIATDGKVHDPQRIDFTRRYLRELRRCASDGIDVRGYFHWSIMDNFEWAEGFTKRFGMIHVDYTNQKRTLKESADWYSQVIKTNGASLDE
ncbi:MAG TPA: GH1 family beta-glucosidase [Tepidisphaeraceae bacterium]|nr:GH1 family beta-glucosidase [Tepidisphaeraceae bacterium]